MICKASASCIPDHIIQIALHILSNRLEEISSSHAPVFIHHGCAIVFLSWEMLWALKVLFLTARRVSCRSLDPDLGPGAHFRLISTH
jgi:hypothetical protein